MKFQRERKFGNIPDWLEILLYLGAVNLIAMILVYSGLASVIWEGTHPGEEIKPNVLIYASLSLYVVFVYLLKGKRINVIEIYEEQIIISYSKIIFYHQVLRVSVEKVEYNYKKRYIPKRKKNDYVLMLSDGKNKYKIVPEVDGWKKEIVDSLLLKIKECKMIERNSFY